MDSENMSMPSTSANTSGQGPASIVPKEIKGLNWGAFGLNWVWGIFNSTYLAFLVLIPFINIIMIFVLLLKGNEWAWRNKHWDSVEQFKAVQKKWTIAWLAISGLGILFVILSALLGGANN